MIGTTVGSYRITAKVSVGGMGTVYKAEHTLIGKQAAVKVLHPELSGNRDVVQRFQDQQVRVRGEQASRNLEAGKKFLSDNAKKEGVATLPGGVQYKVLRAADGAKPGVQDTVVVHYKGTLIDGKEFDSSYRRGEPATIPLKNVIKGWQDAVTAMPVGSKWEIYVPAQLGYGEQGAGRDIGPNSTLVFEIELLEIKK